MATVDIGLNESDTGKTISDFTWEYCKSMSNGSSVSTVSSTLTELGKGRYLLTNPNVIEDSSFFIYLTSDLTKYIAGVFEIAAGDIARASVLGTPVTTIAGDIASVTTDLNDGTSGLAALLTAINTKLSSTDSRLNNLDSKISNTFQTSGYIAPDNSDIQTILNKIEDGSIGLNALLTAINSRLAYSSYIAPDNASITIILSKLNDGTSGLAALLTVINSKLDTISYTAPNNAAIAAIKDDIENVSTGLLMLTNGIKEQTDKLIFTNDNKVEAFAVSGSDVTLTSDYDAAKTAAAQSTVDAIKLKTDTINWNDIIDIKDGTLGSWVLDPTHDTMTFYRENGTILKVFHLGKTAVNVPNYITRE